MKTIRYLLVLSVASILAGCATTFRPWNLSSVHEGMNRDQVVHILGSPDFTDTKNGTEQMHYAYREDFSPSRASEPFYDQDTDRAFRDLNSKKAFKEYKYVVILVDDKVINYKEL